MTKVGVLHENARISRSFWRKLINFMSIWANYIMVPYTVDKNLTGVKLHCQQSYSHIFKNYYIFFG